MGGAASDGLCCSGATDGSAGVCGVGEGGGGGADSRNATPTKKKRGRPRKNSPRFIKKSNKNDMGSNKEAAKTLFSDQGRYSVLA